MGLILNNKNVGGLANGNKLVDGLASGSKLVWEALPDLSKYTGSISVNDLNDLQTEASGDLYYPRGVLYEYVKKGYTCYYEIHNSANGWTQSTEFDPGYPDEDGDLNDEYDLPFTVTNVFSNVGTVNGSSTTGSAITNDFTVRFKVVKGADVRYTPYSAISRKITGYWAYSSGSFNPVYIGAGISNATATASTGSAVGSIKVDEPEKAYDNDTWTYASVGINTYGTSEVFGTVYWTLTPIMINGKHIVPRNFTVDGLVYRANSGYTTVSANVLGNNNYVGYGGDLTEKYAYGGSTDATSTFHQSWTVNGNITPNNIPNRLYYYATAGSRYSSGFLQTIPWIKSFAINGYYYWVPEVTTRLTNEEV